MDMGYKLRNAYLINAIRLRLARDTEGTRVA